ncbi:MAG: hypothetical protein OXG33_13885 [Chloroflexi bacterium]|nr:hypothetical protein [Chloroflexota bacterium]
MTVQASAAELRTVAVPRSRWWLLMVRAVVPLLFANAQIGLLWPEDLKAPPAIVFGIFALVDGALALAVALGMREFRPARGLVLADAALGAAAGITGFLLWLVVWSDSVVPAAAYVGLAGTWAFLSGLLHAAVAIPLRRLEGAQMPLLFIIVSGLVRMAYGVPTGLSALVVLNFTGFRRFLSVQQWFVLLHGITYLLFYGGLAEVWRERRQTEVATQERIARKDLQVRQARERRAAQEFRTV